MEYEVREIEDLESYPPFILDLYDRDTGIFEGGNDFLARAIVEPEDCSIVKQSEFDPCKAHDNQNCTLCLAIRTQAEIPGTPRWHPLKYTQNDPESGQVLCSFSVTQTDYTYNIDPPYVDLRSRVNVEEFDVDMLILGLRNL